MIVIGADPHKSNHCFAAADAGTGELRSSEAVEASAAGLERALAWGRDLGRERVWAIEDCRHVSGGLERFLVARGERVVRVAPKLMAGARERPPARQVRPDRRDRRRPRRAARGRGHPPDGVLGRAGLEIKLLLDHHDLVSARTADQSRLRWHLHDLQCPIAVPTGGLDREVWLERLGRWLARQPQTARVRVARRVLARIRAQTREIRDLVTKTPNTPAPTPALT